MAPASAGFGFGGAGLDQFHGDHRAAAADVADHVVPGLHGAQPLQHDRLDRPCGAGQVEFAHGRDGAERGGAGDRVAAVGAAEAAGVHRVHHLGAAGDRGQRQPAGDALGGGDQVGHDALVLGRRTRRRCGRSRSGSRRRSAARRCPCTRRRWPAGSPSAGHDEAALALDRLDQHGGDVGRADLGGDDVDGPGGGLRTGEAAVPERVGHRHPVDLGRRTGRSPPCRACSSRSAPSSGWCGRGRRGRTPRSRCGRWRAGRS